MDTPHSIGVIADTEFGAVRGAIDGSTNVWRGIRYAAPPLRELRFRAPQPPPRTAGVVEATEFARKAPEARSSALRRRAALSGAEDCLTLDVWSPSGGASRKSVLIWLHGGDALRGTGSEPSFTGRSLAENGDVVVVSVNYRRGILGFVDFSSFATPSHPADSNLAVRDVIAALEWVQSNIAQFGGDPGRIALAGESSAGSIVTTLLAVPAARDLFHRAILQSPPPAAAHPPELAARIAATALAMLRIHPADLNRLREAPLPAVVAAQTRLVAATRLSLATSAPIEAPALFGPTPFTATPFAPTIDGTLVREHPFTAIQSGRAHRVPLLIGSNRDALTGIAAVMSNGNDGHSQHATGQATASRMPAVAIADAHSPFAPVWLYRFDYSPPLRKAVGKAAPRSSELPYLWGTLPRGPLALCEALVTDSAASQLSARLQHRWLTFAKLGVPTPSAGEPVWNSYDEHRATMIFDTTDEQINDLDAALREGGDNVRHSAEALRR